MPLVIPAGFCNVVCGVIGPDSKAMSFQFGATVTSDLSAVAATVAEWFGGTAATQWAGIAHSSYVAAQVETRDATSFAIEPVNVVGAGSNAPCTPNVSFKARKNTGLIGRAHRGGLYIPGWVTESGTDNDGTIHSGDLAVMQGALNALMTLLAAEVHDMVLLHEVGSSDVVPTPITSLSALSKVHTQRRRLVL